MPPAVQDRAATSSSFFMRERPFTPFSAARAIRSCLVIPSSPPPSALPPPVSRCLAVFLATSFGCAENCLPFAVSARFFSVLRLYSESVSDERASLGR